MKTLCIATALALIGGSAANAGTILDTFLGGSSTRLKVEDCGTDTCGTISWGNHKFVVKKSEISSVFKDIDFGDKPAPAKPSRKEPPDSPAAAAPAAPAQAAPPARTEDRTPPSTRPDDPPVSAYEEKPAPRTQEPRTEEKPSAAPVADASVAQKVAVAAPAPAFDPKSPVGEWIVEDGDGRVRIRPCGQALCGEVSGAKNPNDTDRHNPDASKRKRPVLGMPVLIDMKPASSNRWEGEVYNAKDGRTYSANLVLKNPNVLRVEGCVFGGLICGGQSWTRAKDHPQG